jgi:tetratricopeptide (TPR) repeat protein
MRRRRCILTLVALLAVLPSTTLALDDGGGRSVFATGAGNRALALGGAYVAVADDASAAVWNPAGLALAPRKQFQITQTSLFGLGFSEQYASLVVPHWRWGSASLTYRRFGVDGIEGRDDRGFLYDDDLEDAESELSLGYAHLLADGHLSLGAAVKVQRHELAGHADSGLGADLGLWARPLALLGATGRGRDLSLGVSLRNAIEPEVKLVQDAVADPLTLRAGLAWQQPLARGVELLLAADLERSADMDARKHLGAECRLLEVLALRAGSSDGTLTAGAGLCWQGLTVDYQYEDNPLGDIHRMGATVSFGATVPEARLRALAAEEQALNARLDAAFQVRLQTQIGNLEAAVRDALLAGRWHDALDGVGSLGVLYPDHQDLPGLEADCWRGLAADQERGGKHAEAAVSFRRALTLEPGSDEARTGLARVQAEGDRLAARGRELKSRFDAALAAFAEEELLVARDGFRAVLALAPDDPDATLMLQRTLAAMTRRASSLAAEGASFAQADRLDLARERLAQARRLDPEAPGLAAADLAVRQAVRRAEQPVVAAAPAADAAAAAAAPPALDPERRRELEDLYQRGIAALADGRRSEAVGYWEVVWAADPAHHQACESLAREYLTRGMEAYATGDLQTAIDQWQEARRVAPHDARALGYLERAQQQLARMEKINRGR